MSMLTLNRPPVALPTPATPEQRADCALEAAMEHLQRFSRQCGDHGRAIRAVELSLQVKALRRPEVTQRLDAERLAMVRGR
jgi:hypothetical protein